MQTSLPLSKRAGLNSIFNLFCMQQLWLVKINHVIYFGQSQLMLAKTNEHRTRNRKAPYSESSCVNAHRSRIHSEFWCVNDAAISKDGFGNKNIYFFSSFCYNVFRKWYIQIDDFVFFKTIHFFGNQQGLIIGNGINNRNW